MHLISTLSLQVGLTLHKKEKSYFPKSYKSTSYKDAH
jgi:hypothetical protein